MRGLAQRLKQTGRLSFADWRVLSAAMVLLPASALLLRLKGYNRARAMARAPVQQQRRGGQAECRELAEAERVVRLVAIAASHGVYRASCLHRALVAQWFLYRQGITTDLRVGVANDAAGFAAHAWLEYRGQALGQDAQAEERFAAFERH